MTIKVGTSIKIIIGIIGILALGFTIGFIGLQLLTVQSPDIEEQKQIVIPNTRRITTSRFVNRAPRMVAKTQQEETNVESVKVETSPIPKNVPTAQSSDDEIKEFSAWLSLSLEREDTIEKTEQEDFSTGDDGSEDQIDYAQERSRVESVIWRQWKDGLESYNIERYMSSI